MNMNHNMPARIRTLIAALLILSAVISTACTASQPADNTSKTQPVINTISVVDIVGKREWKPSEENSLICAAQDSGEGELTYTWSAEKGSIKGSGKKVSWTAPATLGEYSITVKVVSSSGSETTFTRKFKVTDDPYHSKTTDKTIYLNMTIPSSNVLSQPGRLRVYTTGEIQCVVDGVDPANLTYMWTAPAGKLLGDDIASGKQSRVGWIAPGQGGTYIVFVTVTDKEGKQASAQVVFDVLCCRDP
jgi:hypothetical protein